MISLVRSDETFEEHSEEGKEEATTEDEEGTLNVQIHIVLMYEHNMITDDPCPLATPAY